MGCRSSQLSICTTKNAKGTKDYKWCSWINHDTTTPLKQPTLFPSSRYLIAGSRKNVQTALDTVVKPRYDVNPITTTPTTTTPLNYDTRITTTPITITPNGEHQTVATLLTYNPPPSDYHHHNNTAPTVDYRYQPPLLLGHDDDQHQN
jgi:RPE4 domain-containing protein